MTSVIQGDAFHFPLGDETVDLLITSPPYFALRSYRDGGEHYDGQLGSEPTPQAFLEALWAVTKECWRVLKPGGSMFVNLGDKRSGSGGHNNNGLGSSTLNGHGGAGSAKDRERKQTNADGVRATRRNAPDRYNQAAFGRPKSKMLLPHRYAIGCEDGLADPDGIGWIVRQDIVWHKANGLPESVTDRVRDSHEFWFHLTKQGDYFAAVDEVREPQSDPERGASGRSNGTTTRRATRGEGGYTAMGWQASTLAFNPLGKLPGSVWKIASEPLAVPDYMVEDHTGWRLWDAPAVWQHARLRYEAGDMRPLMLRDIDHFAAFPQEWPRRLILGWSPSGICTACGEGRRPVVATDLGVKERETPRYSPDNNHGGSGSTLGSRGSTATITGYACACTPYTDHPGQRVAVSTRTGATGAVDPGNAPRQVKGALGDAPRTGPVREYHFAGWTPPPTRPAVVLDPFSGTGTVIGVARALGRTGVGLDLSADYCRLARWRVFKSGHFSKATARTNSERQGALL